jgi:predicted double-glycine peptidase
LLTIWLDNDMQWYAPASGKRGCQRTFSDAAIQFCLSIKCLFGLALRQSLGSVESLLRLAGLDWRMPDDSTVCRRQKTLLVQLPYRFSTSALDPLVDSTGIKFLGEVEWKRKKHRAELLWQIPPDEPIACVSGDGAYGTKACHAAIIERGAQAVRPGVEGSLVGALARNEALRACRRLGYSIWKKWSGYHRRSLADTKMHCFKRLVSRSVGFLGPFGRCARSWRMKAWPGFVCALAGGLLCAQSVSADQAPGVVPESALLNTYSAQGTVPLKSWKTLRDVRIVKQDLDYSCSAASLATLLNEFYGQSVTEEALLKAMDKGDLRASFEDMQRALPQFGFKAQGFAASYEQLMRLKAPVLVYLKHRKDDHFSVLRGIDANTVWLADPSLGNRTYSKAQFLEMWQTRGDKENYELAGKFLAVLPNKEGIAVGDDFFTKSPHRQSAQATQQLGFKNIP